jgi:hypothetical protein
VATLQPLESADTRLPIDSLMRPMAHWMSLSHAALFCKLPIRRRRISYVRESDDMS